MPARKLIEMLSRRNVRIKAMQVLYALNREGLQPGIQPALRYYERLVSDTYKLYLYQLLALLRVSEYARQDELRKTSKLLPTEEDLAFQAKLANNDCTQSLSKNMALTIAFGKQLKAIPLDGDMVRQLYIDFSKEEPYQDYLKSKTDSKEQHIDILLELYRFLLHHETFLDMVEDNFPLWIDDKSLVVGAIKKTIKALPANSDFLDDYEPGGETIDFGVELLKKVIDLDDELRQLIEPSLRNWDAERVAILDMILIKMALTEYLHFPSIPTKVTLNEFVELSKMYSTDKSKDFVNGILDKLLKELTERKLINKVGRGLLDE